MTLSDFREAARVYHRRSVDPCRPIAVACLIGLLWMLFYQRAKDWLEARLDPNTADWIAVMPLMVPLTIAFVLLIPLARRHDRIFGIRCPACAGELASVRSIVIASRHCPHCGGRVIDEAG